MTNKTISIALRPRLPRHMAEPLLKLPPALRSRVAALVFRAQATRVDLRKLADQLPVLERLEWQMNHELQRSGGTQVDRHALLLVSKILHELRA